ncbi:MAG: PIN domain-containing protein [Alphaproteobacteria bacterium]
MKDIAVFDTNILIDFSHQHPEAQKTLSAYSMRLISIVTWVEFLTGIPDMQENISRAFLQDMFDIIYPEQRIYEQTLAIRRARRLKLPDAMIYATSLIEGVPLITRNTKDFDESMDGVYIPYT